MSATIARERRESFTIGVFPDVTWAARGLEALRKQGFSSETVSVLAKHTPESAALVSSTFGVEAPVLEIKGLGATIVFGPLVDVLQGADGALAQSGVAATIRRVGFQAHDGVIFESLAARGGVLVAIEDDVRAADALALLHSYGGGNAAIGAWTGRV